MILTDAKRAGLSRLFEENFSLRGEVGASVSVWAGGEEVLSLAGGTRERDGVAPWDEETPVPVWSATKGASAAAFLLALEENGLAPGSEVREFWPSLARGDNAGLSFGHVLSHRAGLPALDQKPSIQDYGAVITALEAQLPFWPPDEGHGYHPRTWGFLLDELLRRVTGAASLGEFWHDRIAGPLGLEFWIGGVPEEVVARVAPVYAGRPRPEGLGEDTAFYNAFGDPGSFTHRAFTSPAGLDGASRLNNPLVWELGLASMGGLATARGLGKFYALLANGGRWEGQEILPAAVLGWMEETLTDGEDLVFLRPTAFSAGFMKDPIDPITGIKSRRICGPSLRAFGHPGAGGSHGFADPEAGLSFAYVMNQMELGVLPNAKSLRLMEALYM